MNGVARSCRHDLRETPPSLPALDPSTRQVTWGQPLKRPTRVAPTRHMYLGPMLLQSFGLFWERDDVAWSPGPGKAPSANSSSGSDNGDRPILLSMPTKVTSFHFTLTSDDHHRYIKFQPIPQCMTLS